MAIKFPDPHYAYYPNCSQINNTQALAISAWIRVDTVTTPDQQGLLSHRGATNQFWLRKDSTTDYLKWSVTAGGVNKTVSSTTAMVSAAVHHVCVDWYAGNSMNIYVDHVLEGTTSTTTQTSNYDSGSSTTSFFISIRSLTTNIGVATFENIFVWRGRNFSQRIVDSLYYDGWWQNTPWPAPTMGWAMDGRLLTRIPDVSGNGCHIETVDTHAEDAGLLGKYGREATRSKRYFIPTAAGPTSPDWTYVAGVTHPTHTYTATGLTNGTEYEFYVTAVNSLGTESVPSSTVSATPYAVPTVHTPRKVFLGH